MEQLDTDEKLVENSKDKKKSQDYSKYVLIGVMCLVVLFALIFIFNYIKNGSAGQTDSSKKIYFLIYFLYNRQKISSTNS